MRPVILGALLGLFSGIVPGPFSALVATSALKGGFWAGFRIAIVPLVTESVVLGLAALFLRTLNEDALQWMGFLGGLFVFYLAYRTWKEAESTQEGEPLTGARRLVVEGVFLAVLSPAPWVFWILIGAPLFLGSLNEGWDSAALFFGSFLACLVGVHVGVAALAGMGERRLSGSWRRRLLRAASVLLVGAGGLLLWQSYVGNFQRMVAGSETIEDVVNDRS